MIPGLGIIGVCGLYYRKEGSQKFGAGNSVSFWDWKEYTYIHTDVCERFLRFLRFLILVPELGVGFPLDETLGFSFHGGILIHGI